MAGIQGNLRVLQDTMAELEAMLREVEMTSAIVELEAPNFEDETAGAKTPRTPRSPGTKQLLRGTANSVRLLADDLSEQLRIWREYQELELMRQDEDHKRMLQELVASRTAEEEDRLQVRVALRIILFQIADGVLGESLIGTASLKPRGATPGNTESVGSWALMELQTWLDTLVVPVEGLQPSEPLEMQNALRIAKDVLERKRARSHGPAQRSCFLEQTSYIDDELLREAAAIRAKRLQVLTESVARREAIMKEAKDSTSERYKAFFILDANSRSGPAPVEFDTWQSLWPARQHVKQRKLINATEIRNDIEKDGNGRVEAMLDEFSRRYMPGNRSGRAAEFEQYLDLWKFGVREELLTKLCNNSEEYSKRCLQNLKASVEQPTPVQQTTIAVERAKDFHASRAKHFEQQFATCKNILVQHSKKSLASLASRRRRVEWCALKHFDDLHEGVTAFVDGAETKSVWQLGVAAQRLVAECHEALPMFGGALEPLGRPSPSPLYSAWNKSSTPSRDRLTLIERAMYELRDTAETCAILKGFLCLIDEEMRRVDGVLNGRAHVLNDSTGGLAVGPRDSYEDAQHTEEFM